MSQARAGRDVVGPHLSLSVVGVSAAVGRRSKWPVCLAGLVSVCVAFAAGHVVGTAVSPSLTSIQSGTQPVRSSASLPSAARSAFARDLGSGQVSGRAGHLVTTAPGISATFARDGVVARSGPGTSLELGLTAIGRGNSLSRVGAVSPVGESNRVSYTRAGIDEWYADGPIGLEQGFTVNNRISGAGELTLAVGRVPATEHVSVSRGGTGITVQAGGRSLSYKNLTVTDATGRHIGARMSVADHRVLLTVNDGGAPYPLHLDPTVETGGAVLTSDTDDASHIDPTFGAYVAMSGDGRTVVVSGGQGAAYVFSEPSAGDWEDATETAQLTASDGSVYGQVSISGDGSTIAVAGSVPSGQGAVYVFSKPSSGEWQNTTQTAELTTNLPPNSRSAQSVTPSIYFPTSLAISEDGSSIVAGAPGELPNDIMSGAEGSAFVYSEPSSGWQNALPTAELTEAGALDPDQFGEDVAVSGDGDTVVVDAPFHLTGRYAKYGPWVFDSTAFVFTKPTGGGWQDATQSASLTTTDAQSGISGLAISRDGDTIAFGSSTDFGTSNGLTYLFTKSGSDAWASTTQTAALTSSDSRLTGGVAVSSDGGTVVVGARSGGQTPAQAVDVFREPQSGWQSQGQDQQSENLVPAVGNTEFAGSLAVSADGDIIVAGNASPTPSVSGDAVVFPPPPKASIPPAITPNSDPTQGQTLTEQHGDWSGDPTSYTYAWERCDATGGDCSAIPGATGQSYLLSNADAGHTIVVQETASNIGGVGAAASSAPAGTVIPLPPAPLSGVGLSGDAVKGAVLTAAPGAWSNAPTYFSYSWEECDMNGLNCAVIPGASDQTYRLVAGDIGQRVRAVVTATNAGGSSSPFHSGLTTAVAGSGPVGFVIDNGAYATNDPNVTIQAMSPVGTQSVLVANDGGFRTDVQTFAPATTIAWKLKQTGNDRLSKTVYLRFLGVGQDDINFTDDIILDETAPTIQAATLTGGKTAQSRVARAAKLKTYRLTLKAKDSQAGVCKVATNNTRSTKNEVVTSLTSCHKRGMLKVSRTLKLKLSSQPRYVRVLNSAGSWSRWVAAKD
jgi:hypothetical protein